MGRALFGHGLGRDGGDAQGDARHETRLQHVEDARQEARRSYQLASVLGTGPAPDDAPLPWRQACWRGMLPPARVGTAPMLHTLHIQNLALIDGIPIYQPFHLIAFYSAFPSDIIQVANIYAGGFGARFGGRLSSVLDIATRNGNKRRFEGSLSVAPFVSGLLIEGPLLPGTISLLAQVNATRSQ